MKSETMRGKKGRKEKGKQKTIVYTKGKHSVTKIHSLTLSVINHQGQKRKKRHRNGVPRNIPVFSSFSVSLI